MDTFIDLSPLNFIYFSLIVIVLMLVNSAISSKIKNSIYTRKKILIFKSVQAVLILIMAIITFYFLVMPGYDYYHR